MKHLNFSLLSIRICQCLLLHEMMMMIRLGHDATAIGGTDEGQGSNSFFCGMVVVAALSNGSMHMNNKSRPKKSDVNTLALKLGLKLVPTSKGIVSTGTGKGSSPMTKSISISEVSIKTNTNTGINIDQKSESDGRIEKSKSANSNIKKKIKNKQKRAKKKSKSQLPPTISWGIKARKFFWGGPESGESSDAKIMNINSNSNHEQHHYLENAQNLQYISSGGRQLKVEVISNEQGFPLYQVHNVLSRQALNRAISLLMEKDIKESYRYAEELEQHELVKGERKPRVLRRSLVSQLSYSCDSHYSRELIDLILAGLPIDLVEGMHEHTDKKISNNTPKNHPHPHPYEDGSVVYYRATGNDFYSTHHDSYDPEDPPRRHQRAYTILLYLRVPEGSPEVGGTEFPRLTKRGHLSSNKKNESNLGNNKSKESEAIVVKPRAGDAICWPNFDLTGKPYMDSIHGALPIPKERRGKADSRIEGIDSGENYTEDHDEKDLSKIVVNLWFEGSSKNRHSLSR